MRKLIVNLRSNGFSLGESTTIVSALHLTVTETSSALGSLSMTDVMDLTQKNWLRPTGLERWNQWEPHIDDDIHLNELLQNSPFCQQALPQEKHFDNVLLMSAIEPVFEDRVKFFFELCKQGLQAKRVFLVGGERALTVNTDPKSFLALGDKAKESDMLKYFFDKEQKQADFRSNAPVYSTHTPYQQSENGAKRRPNTFDTVVSWKNEFDDGGSILCISNQPYVCYQTEVIRSILKDRIIMGSGNATTNPRNSIILDTIARLIYVKCGEHLKKHREPTHPII